MTAQGVVVRLTDRRGDVIAAVKAPLKDPSHDIGAEVAAEKMAAHHDEHRSHHPPLALFADLHGDAHTILPS